MPEVLVETPVENGVDGAVGEHQEHGREVHRLVPRRKLKQARRNIRENGLHNHNKSLYSTAIEKDNFVNRTLLGYL